MPDDAPRIEIGGREVGAGRPVYIVAEISANHRQKYEEAANLIHVAKQVGADAVKVQTYTPDTLTLDVDSPLFRHGEGSLWAGRTLYDLYREAHMPWEWQPRLKELADGLGIDFFSSAFDPTAVDFLEGIGVPAHKVASFEIVDLPLIEKMAATGKPMILSTGMASREEIDEAVRAARAAGARQIALLKCTSAYPAAAEEMNLRTIPHLAGLFGMPVGLSDHTAGHLVAVAAVALGASIVEKHFTLSRAVPGPDSAFSMEPAEFQAMVEAIRTVERSLGAARFGPEERERQSLAFRRSLFAVRDIRAGEALTDENVRSIRPAHGLAPKHLKEILGRKATRDIPRGTPLDREMVER